ncbi:tautomerase family protein [Candidatus Pelagibacter sp.]|jgi:phenylpyruvate tautomerase PptA (4-oxalocrotonate tautomerase family)|nr:tautomerase family protein [Candidatus Pelagibacter sp.]|tara:strand:- start:382 stop:822 length:441 start_codon:yes stop_codon:yes gene_type:complete
MPTYTVTNSNFNLTSKQQKNLAEGITKVHNAVTGANTYFAQVIFNKTKKNNHFMGGKKVKEPSLFLLGQIRAGRPKKVKDKLISELKNILVKKSKLDETQVWAYIVDLPPSQMIEYGSVLPESGKEKEWFKNLPTKLKKKLLKLEK